MNWYGDLLLFKHIIGYSVLCSLFVFVICIEIALNSHYPSFLFGNTMIMSDFIQLQFHPKHPKHSKHPSFDNSTDVRCWYNRYLQIPFVENVFLTPFSYLSTRSKSYHHFLLPITFEFTRFIHRTIFSFYLLMVLLV